MKTAEEIIDDIQKESSMGPYEYLMYDECILVMKAYAEQVATQALKDAAERAKTKFTKKYGFQIDKESIIDTPITTP
jgi:hypothetical protein